MNVIDTALPGVKLIEPDAFGDDRGLFMITWNRERYCEAGLPEVWEQDNLSISTHGVLRGLHYQNPHGQGKLVGVLEGSVFDVAVDIRESSPTFGKWVGVELSSDNHRQLYVPPGFAHGFCVTSERALFSYKVSDIYAPQYEASILWNDPAIGIDWPLSDVQLSDKDAAAPCLADVEAGRLPVYEG